MKNQHDVEKEKGAKRKLVALTTVKKNKNLRNKPLVPYTKYF